MTTRRFAPSSLTLAVALAAAVALPTTAQAVTQSAKATTTTTCGTATADFVGAFRYTDVSDALIHFDTDGTAHAYFLGTPAGDATYSVAPDGTLSMTMDGSTIIADTVTCAASSQVVKIKGQDWDGYDYDLVREDSAG